jgi:GAF domain-containing protein
MTAAFGALGQGLEPVEARAQELATEQAALRQVATLVASEPAPDQLFAVVAEQVARVFAVSHVTLVRYEPDGSVVVGGFSEGDREPFPMGSLWPLDSPGVIATVRKSGRPARVDYAHMTGEVAAVVRGAGVRFAVAGPIVVERRLWGAMVVFSPRDEPLPEDTEARLTDFTELVATAIANSESRVAIGRLLDEQAALRRVATLVAGGTGAEELFGVVADEVHQLLGAEASAIVRFEDDETVVTVGTHRGPYPAGTRTELDPHFVVGAVRRTRRAARFDTEDPAAADIAAIMRDWGIRSAVASPILVEGELWGAIVVASARSLPQESEARLGDFTELVATAVANTQARQEVTALAEQQAALRRVATVVAQEASHEQVFSTIAREIGELLGLELVRVVRYEGDGTAVVVAGSGMAEDLFPVGSRTRPEVDSAASRVFRTGEPIRIDDYETSSAATTRTVRSAGVRGVVATPIWVEGRLWGSMNAGTTQDKPLPPDTEGRLGEFTELMATAIANAESREARAVLTEEQAALRRVATLAAEAAPPADIFSAVSREVAALFRTELVVVGKFEGDPAELLVVGVGDGSQEPGLGSRWKLDDALASTAVYRTGLAARFDHDSPIADPDVAAIVERFRPVATVAVPIKVEGRPWGAMIVSTPYALLPTDTEERLQRFTDLMATAIANAEARAEVERLAEEQAALRRVATLVARGAQPDEVCLAVSDEVGRLFGTELAAVGRFEPDGRALDVVGAGRIHERWELADFLPATEVFRTGRSARADSSRWESAEGETAERLRSLGVVSTAASPIVVEDALWGVMTVADPEESLPPETEERLEKFTELVATAIANAESREARAVLTEEQAALGRVATLVAEVVPASELFGAVALEVSTLFGAAFAGLARFEGESVLVVGESVAGTFPQAARLDNAKPSASAEVLRTGRSARVDGVDWSEVSGPLGEVSRHLGVASTVACPIVVEGRTWGAVSISSTDGALPPDTEERLEKFSDLVATAIANAEGRSELAASRRRIVAASDDARRRIERDLHDGVQQQLVSLGLELGALKADPATGDAIKEQLDSLTEDVVSVFDALVEIARGIHPAILSQGGLAAALRALARRSAVPVELHAQIEDPLPDEVEVAAYYVVAETLTNSAKHAGASVVHVDVTKDDGTLKLMVRDDGVGGADPRGGSGLVGLEDRVEALGGTITIDSSAGSGTRVVVTLPIAAEPDQEIESFLRPPQEPGSPTSPA